MITMQPPPPPPPLPPVIKSRENESPQQQQQRRKDKKEIWEEVIHTLSTSNEISGQDETILVLYRPILSPILQCGPVCGLVALAEAGQILTGVMADPAQLLEEAIRCKMSKSGEMFSALDMQRLGKTAFNYESKVINTDDAWATWGVLVNHLLQGNVALIPYDADHNHTPTKKKGHSAHWAVIHGITIPLPTPPVLPLSMDAITQDNLLLLDPAKSQQPLSRIIQNMALTTTIMKSSYVLAHHGKSKRIALWKYCDLITSNQNLMEVSPKISSSVENYIFGDIKEELCSKLVLLEKPSFLYQS